MKFLLTGGAGFIGMSLTHKLLNLGHTVYSVDSFSDYYSIDLKHSRIKTLINKENFKFFTLDLVEKDLFKQLLLSYQPDSVIHLAAQPGVRLTLAESDKYARENLLGFHNCLISTLEAEIPNFMFASSSSVYGDDSKIPFNELDRNLNPISYYGATKLANENLARALASSKTKMRGLRFFTVYGPWGRPDMAYFKLIVSALNGGIFTKFGDGNVKRDFTYIDDTVNSIYLLSEEMRNSESTNFEIVNIGGGKPSSLNDLIFEIESQLDRKIVKENFEPVVGDVKLTIADSQKLYTLTGHAPETSLKRGIEETIRWALQNGVRNQLSNWIK